LLCRSIHQKPLRGLDALSVTQTFVEEDAKLILSLLVHVDMEDMIACHNDNRGVSAVRSAYKLQREIEL
jgi:hypothetical protein